MHLAKPTARSHILRSALACYSVHATILHLMRLSDNGGELIRQALA
jgi:hypothetical protein